MDSDTVIRLAAFAHIRRLIALTADDLALGFQFEGVRIPLINPRFIHPPPEGRRRNAYCR
jgi:hypothetical protein